LSINGYRWRNQLLCLYKRKEKDKIREESRKVYAHTMTTEFSETAICLWH
jgi:hypothetical protein